MLPSGVSIKSGATRAAPKVMLPVQSGSTGWLEPYKVQSWPQKLTRDLVAPSHPLRFLSF